MQILNKQRIYRRPLYGLKTLHWYATLLVYAIIAFLRYSDLREIESLKD